MRRLARLFFVLATLGGMSGSLLASQDDVSLAAKAAALLQKSMPQFDATIFDPLTIRLEQHGKTQFEIHLDRIDRLCRAEPARCDAMLADFVMKIAEASSARSVPLDAASLRTVVRPADYVGGIVQEMGGAQAGIALVSEPVAGDLVALCYFDLPTTMRPVTSDDLARLGLTPHAAMRTCNAQVKAALKPLAEQLKELPAQEFGYLIGDPYESSYILFHDDWAPLAAKFDGHLLVSVPGADAVLYGRERDREALAAFSELTKKFMAKAERPISSQVLRWTPAGWEVASP